ncbi:MAG: hypothetical protein IPH53_17200 [Flavobacteriales bacterium]|nr:hypothetical protein [Flavobacteriales bacterium]
MLNEETKLRLKERLDQVHEWPSVYMFKFIFEPEQSRLDAVLALFPRNHRFCAAIRKEGNT